MRRIIHSQLGRMISKLLILTLILSVCSDVIAQVTSGDTLGTSRWAVIDFTVKSGNADESLGRLASDSVAVEFNKTNRYDITPRSTVDQELKNLQLNLPLNKLGFLRLGSALDVQNIVFGQVESVKVSGNPKVAQVVISVRVIDVASGLEVNGAYGSGKSSPRPGYSGADDTLIQEAIAEAAFEAVNSLKAFTLPEATVLNMSGSHNILLNKGQREGIKEGMKMIILRNKEEVAVVQITLVEPDSCIAKIITEYKGVAPGDKARAAFELPSYKMKGDKVALSKPRITKPGGIGKMLMPVIIALGVAVIVMAGGGGGTSATEAVKAEALNVTTVNSPQVPIGAAVRLSWATTLFAKGNKSAQNWLIYRSDFNQMVGGMRAPVDVVAGNQHYAIEEPGVKATLDFPAPAKIGSDDLNNQNVDNVPGIVPGNSYVFQVGLVYSLDPLESPNGATSTQYFPTDPSNPSGLATPLNLPVLLTPTNGSSSVLLTAAKFSWNAVSGANQYFLEVSTDPTFVASSSSGHKLFTWGPMQTVQSTGMIATEILNIRSTFENFTHPVGTFPNVYWRVGASRIQDNPGPYPDTHGHRFIWSQAYQFQSVEFPPPPP